MGVYRRSLTWLVQPDEALTLSVDPRQRGPVVLEVDGPRSLLAGLAAGDPVRRQGPALWFGRAVCVELAPLRLWDPPLPALTGAAAAVLREAIFRGLTASDPGAGLSQLVTREVPTSVWARTASPRVDSLLAGLRTQSPAVIHASVQGLVGLGPGLTPAGDDFLAGMLAALQALGIARSLQYASLLCTAISRAAHGTTLLSRQLLRWAMRGRYGETVHSLFVQAARASPAPLDSALTALLAVGSTSGADTAAGIWFALGLCR